MSRALPLRLMFALASLTLASAQTAQQIVEESVHRAQSRSLRYEGRLQVTNAHGKPVEKRWQLQRVGLHGSSKIIFRFTDPPQIKGVALLIVNHPGAKPDSWLWIPASHRERRIDLQNPRFFDTDFSLDDLEPPDLKEYDYELAGQKDLDGSSCWIIRTAPRSKSAHYTFARLYIRQKDYAIAQVEDYVDQSLVRTLTFGDIHEIQGIATPHVIEVTDFRRRSRTTLKLESVQYDLLMRDEDFTLAAIKKSE